MKSVYWAIFLSTIVWTGVTWGTPPTYDGATGKLQIPAVRVIGMESASDPAYPVTATLNTAGTQFVGVRVHAPIYQPGSPDDAIFSTPTSNLYIPAARLAGTDIYYYAWMYYDGSSLHLLKADIAGPSCNFPTAEGLFPYTCLEYVGGVYQSSESRSIIHSECTSASYSGVYLDGSCPVLDLIGVCHTTNQNIDNLGSRNFYYRDHITKQSFLFNVNHTFEQRVQILRDTCNNQPTNFVGRWEEFPG